MWSLVRENDESGVYDSFWHQRGLTLRFASLESFVGRVMRGRIYPGYRRTVLSMASSGRPSGATWP